MHYYRKEPPPMALINWSEDCFELFSRIDPVVLIIREGRSMHAIEHNHAGRLMRQLDHFGRDGVRIIGLFADGAVADVSSLRALNCYLRHGPGLDQFRRAPGLHRNRHPFHRYGWAQLKTHVGLRFSR